MRRVFMSMMAVLMVVCTAVAQRAKKPAIMIRPSDTWCYENGYVKSEKIGGKVEKVTDYEEALKTSSDLGMVITKLQSMMNDRGYQTTDFLTNIKGVKERMARNSGITSKSSGSNIATSFMDEINNQAKADIYFDVYWKVNQNGPKTSISYTLSGLDAYTYQNIASTQGTGKPSFSAEIPVLVEEAVVSQMDAFLAQLQAFFDKCIDQGRPIRLEINTFGNGIDMEKEFKGKELREIIEDWVSDNTVGRAYNLVDDSETSMLFQDVRIPLFDAQGRPQDAGKFAKGLVKMLEATYGIKSKQGKRSLGVCQLILGEK